MLDGLPIQFAIQPVGSVFRDTLRNKYWIGAFLLVLVVWIALFSGMYFLAERNIVQDDHKTLDALSSIYFTIVNITTVGFGDIHPHTHGGKIIAILNSLFGVVSFGLLVAIISAALQPSSLTAEGTIGSPSPKAGGSDSTGQEQLMPRTPIVDGPSGTAAAEFLKSLATLLNEVSESPRRAHFSVRVDTDEGEELGLILGVHVVIERMPRG